MAVRANVTGQIAAMRPVPSQRAASSETPAPSALAPATKPRLFASVAGVSDYADKRIRLAFAISDAKDVARGIKKAGGDLYRSAEVKLLTDTEVTRDKLDAAFAEMAGKVSTSGHGKTVDGRC